jgi:hypothetical protein
MQLAVATSLLHRGCTFATSSGSRTEGTLEKLRRWAVSGFQEVQCLLLRKQDEQHSEQDGDYVTDLDPIWYMARITS